MTRYELAAAIAILAVFGAWTLLAVGHMVWQP